MVELLALGETTDSRDDLFWVCVLLLMLLCWFRADTMAGIRRGDVRFARDSSLVVTVRKMKGRPEFVRRPGLVQVPPAGPCHPRGRIFVVLHRLLDVEPDAIAGLRQLLPRPGARDRSL
eukprot:SAG11_NODE_11371_length_765_cov_1.138138_1_plen_119_part_00